MTYSDEGLDRLQAAINVKAMKDRGEIRTPTVPACLICAEHPRMLDGFRDLGHKSACSHCWTKSNRRRAARLAREDR